MKNIKTKTLQVVDSYKLLLNSLIPSKKFYKTILKKRFSDSILYFLSFVFLLNLIMFIIFIFKINASLNFNKLPENLIINIENGFLSTNSNKPVFIWADSRHLKKLIAVIDETATSEKIKQYKSSILLTANNLVINYRENYEIIKLPYARSNIKITKINIFPAIVRLMVFYMIIFTPFLTITFLLSFLGVISLFMYLIFKFWAKKTTYKKTFQISLHAITLPVIIYSFLLILNNSLINSINSLIFLFLSFLFITISLYDAYL